MKYFFMSLCLLIAACGGDNQVIYSDDPLINQEFDVCKSQGGTNVYLLVEVIQTGDQFPVTYCDLNNTIKVCKQALCKTGGNCPNNCL